MKFRYLFTILFFLFITGCFGKKQPLPKPEWKYQSEAIELKYRADNQLNIYNNRAHTMLLGVYQFQYIKAFKRIIQGEAGIKKLLQWPGQDTDLSKLNLPGCMDMRMIVINPGEKRKLLLDRAKDAQWIGIVAGYYELAPKKCCRLYKIPFKYKKKGLIFKETRAVIPNCIIELDFGPYGILTMQGETF